MKNKYLVISAAIAAFVGAAASAHAAGIPYSSGDLILGFQDSANSIQFDLGNGNVDSAAAGTIGSVLGTGQTIDLDFNVNTALGYTGSGNTGYGSGWATNGGISWTVAGKDAANFYTGMAETAPLSTLASGPATPNSSLVSNSPFGDSPAVMRGLEGWRYLS